MLSKCYFFSVQKVAKLAKKIASLEGERRSFNRGKRDSEWNLDGKTKKLNDNRAIIAAMTGNWEMFTVAVKTDGKGNRLNPIRIDGVDSTDEKAIGKKLQEIASKTWKKEDKLKR